MSQKKYQWPIEATAAMHQSETPYPGGCRIHTRETEQRARRHPRQTSDLREAIEHRELSVHYQPQYEVRGGRACGVEALARWFPRGGVSIPPEQFIPQAERTGLISVLGAWVLQEACSTVMSWSTDVLQLPILCVNVSSHQICHEFTTTLERTLAYTGFPATRLELEITEGTLIANPELALACFDRWRHIGVRIAIDDFGTGYSGLNYLSRFPVDRLKIDKSLIHRMVSDGKTAAIVRAVIRLGEELGFEVLAEGVESERHFNMLADMDCRQVQGYLLARPASADEARQAMTRKWGARCATKPLTGRAAVKTSHAS